MSEPQENTRPFRVVEMTHRREASEPPLLSAVLECNRGVTALQGQMAGLAASQAKFDESLNRFEKRLAEVERKVYAAAVIFGIVGSAGLVILGVVLGKVWKQ